MHNIFSNVLAIKNRPAEDVIIEKALINVSAISFKN